MKPLRRILVPVRGGPTDDEALKQFAESWTSAQAQFVDDVHLPNMAHVAFKRSDYAHAAILSVDVSEARAMPGSALHQERPTESLEPVGEAP